MEKHKHGCTSLEREICQVVEANVCGDTFIRTSLLQQKKEPYKAIQLYHSSLILSCAAETMTNIGHPPTIPRYTSRYIWEYFCSSSCRDIRYKTSLQYQLAYWIQSLEQILQILA